MYGLIGHPLSHSYSKQVHSLIASYGYELFDVKKEDIPALLSRKDVDGFNVTIPYKQTVIKYLDEIDADAKRIGAVNTVVKRGGRLLGFNTDCFGMRKTLERTGQNFDGKSVLVCGSGGTSLTAQTVLKDMGAKVFVVSRRGGFTYADLPPCADRFSFLLNATPVGMFPDVGVAPVDIGLFTNLTGVMDCVYNPLRTKLLFDAERRGVPCVGGLKMLVAQAVESKRIFTGEETSDEEADRVTKQIEKSSLNILLVGMPGAGKTTVGRELAYLMGRQFFDTDELIEKRTGKSAAKWITEEGEDRFRAVEAQTVGEVTSDVRGAVIAVGGGAVRSENEYSIAQNAFVVWLQRPLNCLALSDRPLSADNLDFLAKTRYPLYEKTADCVVKNDRSVALAVKEIYETFSR